MWDTVRWFVYQSPNGETRVEAPRVWWPSGKRGKCDPGQRPLGLAEIRKGEFHTNTVDGVSRRTVIDLIRKHGTGLPLTEAIGNFRPPFAPEPCCHRYTRERVPPDSRAVECLVCNRDVA